MTFEQFTCGFGLFFSLWFQGNIRPSGVLTRYGPCRGAVA